MDDALIDKVAWVGHQSLSGPIRGIVLRFSGLGATGMKGGADPMELEWGQAGALVVHPYHDPWAWMNPPTQRFVDELLIGLRARYGLAAGLPVVATGGSMGGHGALVYALSAPSTVTACVAVSPVCDLPFHYGERPDLPRTMHHAFGSYGDISQSLTAHSPVHQADRMPDFPYLIIHGDQDGAVAKGPHSDALVAAMRARGLDVDYQEPAGMGHCGPLDWALTRRMTEFVTDHLAPP